MKTTSASSVEKWLDSLNSSNIQMRDAKQLRKIGAAVSAVEAAEQELEDAVRAAREAGESWGAIALVLGTSRQQAHRKWAGRLARSKSAD